MTSMIDTFLFFDELELLEFRLRELDAVVDTFVLVESDLTFSGREKRLHFEENKQRFSAYEDRIVHVIHEASTPGTGNQRSEMRSWKDWNGHVSTRTTTGSRTKCSVVVTSLVHGRPVVSLPDGVQSLVVR